MNSAINASEMSKENIKKILQLIDQELSKKQGFKDHQKRMLRIYKAVSSVEKHRNCFVSNFQDDEDDEKEVNLSTNTEKFYRTFEEEIKPSVNIHTDEENKMEFEFEDVDPDKESFKVHMDELNSFIETELRLENSDSSDDTHSGNSQKDKKKARSRRSREIGCNFFNIELKLRMFLKQTETYNILTKEKYDNFINDLRLKSSMSQKNNESKATVSPNKLLFNFFKEKVPLEILKKRYSLNQDLLTKKLFQDVNEIKAIPKKNKFSTNDTFKQSSISTSKDKKGGESIVSKFCPDLEDDEENEEKNKVNIVKDEEDLVTPKIHPPKLNRDSLEKRGSIFDDAFSNEKYAWEDLIEKYENKQPGDDDVRSEFSSVNNSSPYIQKKFSDYSPTNKRQSSFCIFESLKEEEEDCIDKPSDTFKLDLVYEKEDQKEKK